MKSRLIPVGHIINILVPAIETNSSANHDLSTILAQGRERILTAMLRASTVLAFLALLLSLPALMLYKQWFSIGFYTVWLGLGCLIALNRKVAYRLRAGIFLLGLYSLGLFDLLNYGLGEDGRIFLFCFSVTAIILLGARVGIGSLGLSIATIALVGWQISIGQLVIPWVDNSYGIPAAEDILSLCADFCMMAGLVMAALYALLGDFETAWQQKHLATQQVEQERDLLEQHVADRTRELVTARDLALAASRLKTELLARVSHELRTPLGAILGYTELLELGIYGPLVDQQHQATTQIIDSTHYLTNLVNQLLDQAQLDSGKLKLRSSSFKPGEILESILAQMNILAEAKGLRLTTNLAEELPASLSGDPVRVQQILFNLVGNAIKFTTQGAICISLFCPDPAHWAIQVSDTGIGIPTEAQTYIFEPFQQVDGSATREHTGVGLGLSIVKQLVILMNGHITLTSVVRQGSTFKVVLPLIQEPIEVKRERHL